MKWYKRIWMWQWPPKMVKADREINVYDDYTPFMYIFIREDLPKIHKVIQAAHVTYMAGTDAFLGRDFENASFKNDVHFCIFGVKDKDELYTVAWKLQENNLEFVMFYEKDFDIGDSAIAVKPIVGSSRSSFNEYKLLRM